MAQDYDKIIKENLSQSIPDLARRLLKLDIKNTEQVELKLQYTLEREPDFLQKVLDKKGDAKSVLQIEFHSTNERRKMVFRTLVYKGLILMEHDLPVHQWIFYIGNEKLTMDNEYIDLDTQHRFGLIDFRTIDHEIFLNSDRPHEVVFAVLADFKNKKPKVLIEAIARRLIELSEGQLALQQYRKQLEILSKLRNLQKITIKTLNVMPIIYDLKTDIRYLQGVEEKEREVIVNSILKLGLSDKEIVEISGATLKEVKAIRKDLEGKTNGKSKK